MPAFSGFPEDGVQLPHVLAVGSLPNRERKKVPRKERFLNGRSYLTFLPGFKTQGAGAPFHYALSKWRIREYSSIITKLCAKNHTNVLCRRESLNYRLSPRSDSVQPLGHGRGSKVPATMASPRGCPLTLSQGPCKSEGLCRGFK